MTCEFFEPASKAFACERVLSSRRRRRFVNDTSCVRVCVCVFIQRANRMKDDRFCMYTAPIVTHEAFCASSVTSASHVSRAMISFASSSVAQ